MDKKKIAFIIGIIMVIGGIIIGCFSFPGAELTSFAMSLFGAGALCATLWKDRNKEVPSWLSIVALVMVGAGAFLIGFLGLLEMEVFNKLIGYVIAIVMIIIGVIVPPLVAKIKEGK